MVEKPKNFSAASSYLQSLQNQATDEGINCVVGGLVINNQNQIFVQKRSMDRRLFPGAWDIAGGKVEEGETLFAALDRELQEETGWRLHRIINLVEIHDWESKIDNVVSKSREFDFLVEVVGDLDKPIIEEGKFTEFRWVGLDGIQILKEGQENDSTIYQLVKKAIELAQSSKD